ncbi:MAG: hypothetical protein AB8G86_23040 [Saprospiraceae bacterium]
MANELVVRKFRLIELIIQLDDEQAIARLEQEVEKIKRTDNFKGAIKAIKKSTSIDEMIKEQHYKPIKKEDFYKKLAAIDIQEPLEELLKKLTK